MAERVGQHWYDVGYMRIAIFRLFKCVAFQGLVMILVLAGCGSRDVTESSIAPDSVNEEEKQTYEKPNGDELIVSLKQVGRLELLITVTNNSSRDVFLPYLPGLKSERAFFAYVGLEELNPETASYESAESGDFDPGWEPLNPQAKFTYVVLVLTPGTYRANLRYFIDRNFKKRLDENDRLFRTDPESWRRDVKEIDVTAAIVGSISNTISL
jgi:hypothetical protein